MKAYRQGDLILESVNIVIPKTVETEPRVAGRVILAASGESGHRHAIADREAELLHDPMTDEYFLRVVAARGVELLHKEHAVITLDPGLYRVRTQREYTPQGNRRVAD